jgi:hypothetical protein
MSRSVAKIIQLTGNQVADYWEHIRQVVLTSGGSEDGAQNVLDGLLTDDLQCWAIWREVDEQIDVIGFLITEMREDCYDQVRTMLIRSIMSYESLSFDDWLSGFAGLSVYARSKGCIAVTSYTTNTYLLELSRGVPTSQVCAYIVFPVC